MLQQSGFSDAGITADFDIARLAKRGADLFDAFLPRQRNAGDGILDVGQSCLRRSGQHGPRGRVAPLTSEPKRLVLQELSQRFDRVGAAAGRQLDCPLNESRPQISGACDLVWMKRAQAAVPCE